MNEPFTSPAGSLPSYIQLSDPDVTIRTVDPTLLQLLTVAGQIHAWLFHQVLVVTSGNDGHHASGSAHFQNRAVDLRTKDKDLVQQQLFLVVLNHVARERGAGVFDERSAKNNPHFHVELFA